LGCLRATADNGLQYSNHPALFARHGPRTLGLKLLAVGVILTRTAP